MPILLTLVICLPSNALTRKQISNLIGDYNIIDGLSNAFSFNISSISKVSKGDYSLTYDLSFNGTVEFQNLVGRIVKNLMFISIPSGSVTANLVIPVKFKRGSFVDINSLVMLNSNGVSCDTSTLLNPTSVGEFEGDYLCSVYRSSTVPESETNVYTIKKVN